MVIVWKVIKHILEVRIFDSSEAGVEEDWDPSA